jgi:hypothetical protein
VNIAPLLRIVGRVRRVEDRTVLPVPAREAEYDEAGNLLKTALPARPGYEVKDVVVDTDPGGLVEVVFREEAIADAGGFIPTEGDEVDLPVRAYTAWKTARGRRYSANGYSFAGGIYAAEAKSRTGGARAALASTGS